jgi:p-aminobenzoyl-glutamate transporter AbgT
MTEVLILVAIVAGWFIVNRYIFPRLGIHT